ncbi:MAG: hypothetical protein QHI38_04185 [Armatimonadota bacterium]|nr:hypothetical protein [Armatimonadota bacterium]
MSRSGKLKYQLVCAALCVLCARVWAEGFRIDWSSINAAGCTAQGGGIHLSSSIGQAAAGFARDGNFLHWIGFWSGEAPNPGVLTAIGAAKTLPDGAYVSIVGKVTTTSAADFAGFFYIQEQNRTSGLLVVTPFSTLIPARGSIVNVIGTLGTTPAGERFVIGSIVICARGASTGQ